jgi:hypothetical protein
MNKIIPASKAIIPINRMRGPDLLNAVVSRINKLVPFVFELPEDDAVTLILPCFHN